MSTSVERFGSAAVGSACAEVLTLPVDVAKVRLQLQGKAASSVPRYTGLLQTLCRIGSEEGAAALWRGLTPALVRQVSYTSMSFTLYEPVRNVMAGGQPMEEISFWQRVLAGGAAGSISILVMNPTDVVKTQMQTASHEAVAPSMGSIIR